MPPLALTRDVRRAWGVFQHANIALITLTTTLTTTLLVILAAILTATYSGGSYLSDADFELHFKMDKVAFEKLPVWKKNAKKRELRLF